MLFGHRPTYKNNVTSMNSKLGPLLWSRDAAQRILCFDGNGYPGVNCNGNKEKEKSKLRNISIFIGLECLKELSHG